MPLGAWKAGVVAVTFACLPPGQLATERKAAIGARLALSLAALLEAGALPGVPARAAAPARSPPASVVLTADGRVEALADRGGQVPAHLARPLTRAEPPARSGATDPGAPGSRAAALLAETTTPPATTAAVTTTAAGTASTTAAVTTTASAAVLDAATTAAAAGAAAAQAGGAPAAEAGTDKSTIIAVVVFSAVALGLLLAGCGVLFARQGRGGPPPRSAAAVTRPTSQHAAPSAAPRPPAKASADSDRDSLLEA